MLWVYSKTVNAALDARQFDQARALAQAALDAQDGNLSQPWADLAGVYAVEGHLEQAERILDEAIRRFDEAFLYNLRAWVRHTEKRQADSLLDLREAARRQPDNLAVQNNIAATLLDQKAWQETTDILLKILEKDPNHLDALDNLSTVYTQTKRYDKAIDISSRQLQLRPDDPEIYLTLLNQLRSGGFLTRYTEVFDEAKVKAATAKAQRLYTLNVLTYLDDPAWHRQVARRQAQKTPLYTPPPRPAPTGADRRPDKRLRIGYWSCDLQVHATSQLICEVFELHDRRAFETFVLSYGPPSDAPIRDRIVHAADHFLDFHALSDREAVDKIAALDLDILIDLKGYTQQTRMAIPLSRPTPIIVSWLGYPGTLGTNRADYIVGDAIVTPPGCEAFYDERIIRMPGCYQPNDRNLTVAEPLTRKDYGLPDDALVLTAFNAVYKISPAIFDIWMRVLKQCPQACLWLYADNANVFQNLLREAELRGVSATRIVRADTIPWPEHTARYKVADLALDTFPYGSHTTGSDALRVGCPLLALAGQSFASRVSASLLEAVGLPDLVTTSLAGYEARLLDLLRWPSGLRALRARLAHVDQSVLFDTPAFVAALEHTWRSIWQQHLAQTAVAQPSGTAAP